MDRPVVGRVATVPGTAAAQAAEQLPTATAEKLSAASQGRPGALVLAAVKAVAERPDLVAPIVPRVVPRASATYHPLAPSPQFDSSWIHRRSN